MATLITQKTAMTIPFDSPVEAGINNVKQKKAPFNNINDKK